MNLVEIAPVDSPASLTLGVVTLVFGLAAVSLALATFSMLCIVKLRRARAAARSFHELYENIGEGVFRSTLDGRMISANPALVRLNGYGAEAEMLQSVKDIAREWYVDPNRRAELHAILLKLERVGRRNDAARARQENRCATLLRRYCPRGDRDDTPAATARSLRQDRVSHLWMSLSVPAPAGWLHQPAICERRPYAYLWIDARRRCRRCFRSLHSHSS
jgi:PAS domain-containing protein